ncbi:hypothetical protein MF646_22480 [Halalkalibacter sp. MEB205]|uniref:Uncharacterized protein n=1 Tax=Halalkalibacter alkaliphilus TaxID=2917993 RepID=A0A9X2CWY3_9BACI|nr:hypothetical protein [Halalkalibacter alkaliphilus]
MKTTTLLLLIIISMHLLTLINVAFFNGAWNGIVLSISTFLFITALAFYSINKQKNQASDH